MTVIIPIEYSKRRAIEQYCTVMIGPKQYHLHNAVGGESWCIRQNPKFSFDFYGNWTVECSSEHAVIIRLRYGI